MNIFTLALATTAASSTVLGAYPHAARFNTQSEGFTSGTAYTLASHHETSYGWGYMSIVQDETAAPFTELGLKTQSNPAFLGNYVQSAVTGTHFLIYTGSQTLASIQLHIKSTSMHPGAWRYDFGMLGSSGAWQRCEVNFDPNWSDAVAIANGWERTAASVPPFRNVMSAVDFYNIYIPFGADETLYIDDIVIQADPYCPADVNHDDAVNFEDLNILLENWGGRPYEFTEGDTTGDGWVDFADLETLLEAWGTYCAVID